MKLSFVIHSHNNRMGLAKVVAKIIRLYRGHQIEVLIGDTSPAFYSATSKKWLSNEFFGGDVNIVYLSQPEGAKYKIVGDCAALAKGDLLLFRTDYDEYYEEHVCHKLSRKLECVLAFDYVAEGKERAPENHCRPLESCVIPRHLMMPYQKGEWHQNTEWELLKSLYENSLVVHCHETVLQLRASRYTKLDMAV